MDAPYPPKRPKLSRSTVLGEEEKKEGEEKGEKKEGEEGAEEKEVEEGTEKKEGEAAEKTKEKEGEAAQKTAEKKEGEAAEKTEEKEGTTEVKDDNADRSFVWMDNADLMEGLGAMYRGQGTGFFNSPTEPYSSQESQA